MIVILSVNTVCFGSIRSLRSLLCAGYLQFFTSCMRLTALFLFNIFAIW